MSVQTQAGSVVMAMDRLALKALAGRRWRLVARACRLSGGRPLILVESTEMQFLGTNKKRQEVVLSLRVLTVLHGAIILMEPLSCDCSHGLHP
ncbi:hypothetical protein, partial [Azotobacter salinestris]|uniref:hypothetical protein n=1 Tax=Azotobacter salinestris TaxID=69964 RepID=UPI0032DE7890